MYAVAIPVMALVAPGPDVTSTTPGRAVGHVRGSLLVTHQNVFHALLAEDRIVNVQCRAAGIAEYVVDAFVLKRADQHIAAG
jgi:hypothetical protein